MSMTRDAYKAKMTARLDLWNARIQGVSAQAAEATADARIELLGYAEELKAVQDFAAKHLAAVESAASDGWEAVTAGMDQTWERVSGSAEILWARISTQVDPRK